ncbi:MAG: AAA family ATPase [Magnetococcales bacterium]|nr:AAA family ATPase [Magnetococcales bacterium]
MAISLSALQRRQANLPPRILLYGGAGVGKTTLASCAPAAVFLPTEDGLGKLDIIAFPQAKSYADVLGAMDALLNETHAFESWTERLRRSCGLTLAPPSTPIVSLADGLLCFPPLIPV